MPCVSGKVSTKRTPGLVTSGTKVPDGLVARLGRSARGSCAEAAALARPTMASATARALRRRCMWILPLLAWLLLKASTRHRRETGGDGGPLGFRPVSDQTKPVSILRPLVEELAERRERAKLGGGEEKIARQHAAEKLTARERIDLLIDAGTFTELGIHAGIHHAVRGLVGQEAPADGVVAGSVQVACR